MKTSSRQTRLRHPAAVAALLAAFALAPLSQPVFAQTQAVTGFNDNGWSADDVRDSTGASIFNSTTHAPGSGATLNEVGVAAQLDWLNTNGSLGNLGGLSLTGTSTGSGKSTISLVNTSTGLADAATALGSGFSASYRWQNTDTAAPGIGFKIGIQSTNWASSQAGFTAARSGEANWDLLLVYDPSEPGNTPGNTTVNGAFVVSTINYTTGKFYLFGQAGNTNVSAPGFTPKTLAEWAADPTWGTRLFGAGAKVTNTQFGIGSGNASASAILDFASVSYLNSGARIDFVDAARYTGPGTDFGTAANWGGAAPSSTQNLVVEQNATLDVAGAQTARSIGVLAGTTGIVLAPGSTLTLNSAESGTLSTASGATVSVTGTGTLRAATIESAGTINLASAVALDGGALAHPIRDGAPSATSRYGLVVSGDGVVNLQSGAAVTLAQTGKVVGLRVGEGLGVANLTIQAGSQLDIGTATDRGFFVVGDFGATGVVSQTGGTVNEVGAVNIGAQGGTGTYNLSGGTFNVGLLADPTDSNGFSVGARRTGSNAAPTGTLNVSGTGELILTRGYLLVGGDTSPTSGGTGVVNQTGGVVRILKDGLALGSGAAGTANGTYNLNGGVLELGGANGLQASGTGGGSYAFNFGGGTLKVIGTDLSTSINANLVAAKTSTIDTNSLNATWSGNLVGAGLHQIDFGGSSLVKAGLGTLTFAGTGATTRSLDTFSVIGGTVRQTVGATSAVEFMVGSGGGATGSYLMDGGTLTINASTRADNTTPVAASFRVGDFGGSGTFTQTAGTVTVANNGALNIGNQGGSGTYNLQGGSLVLNNGLHVVGRSDTTKAASQGVLNISGGSLTVQNGGSLFLGTNVSNPNSGFSATLNQTGGTLHFDTGTNLYLSAFSNGTYNLNGGTLEIGGSSLQAKYNGVGNGGTFNLGGGTLKVVGSDLTTSANANLVANKTSTIDTNSLNATWSGNLTGAGLHQIDFGGNALFKTGAGTLTFAGTGSTTRSLDTFGVLGGTVRQTAGATSAVEAMVGSGVGATGSYLMDGGTLTINASTRADNTTPVAASMRVGDFGGSGTFTQTAGTLTVADNGALNIGNQGGSGTYNLQGGSLVLNDGLHVVGRSDTSKPASQGVLNVSGGSLTVQNGGSLFLGTNVPNAHSGFSATLNQTGGVVHFDSGTNLYLSAFSNGTYNLSGGTLEIGGNSLQANYSGQSNVGTLNLGGGTIKVVGSDLTTSASANLVANTASVIDTNGKNATWSGNLAGNGLHQAGTGGSGLGKIGAGTLTFAGTGSTTRVLDTFATLGGTTRQTIGATSAVEFMVGSGAGSTSSYLMDGGTLTINAGTLANNVTPVSGSLRIGDFGGSGTFTQTAGTVTVTTNGALNIGNQGGSGTYNLSGGDLVLAGGLNTLGRSTGSNPASSGTLNVSGGTLDITNNSSLVIGNNINNAAFFGTGTINQTGGTVRVSSGALFVAGYGNGSYNLNGGTLEVGGNSLRARYNNTLSTSTFTLGGGTLKVIGSNLTTDVAPVLAAGTTSTIDTNSFNATFTSISGATGHLDKIGAGKLTVGSANIGALAVRGGTLEFTGAAALQSLTVQNGATLAFGTQDLNVAGNVTFDNGSTLALSIGSLADVGSISVGGALSFGSTATLSVTFANGFAPSAPATFNLFTFSSFGGSFAQVNLPTVAGHTWNTSNLATNGTLTLETSAIPEPASFATLAGLALLGQAAMRRRRRAA